MHTELIQSHQYGRVKVRVTGSGEVRTAYSKDLKRYLDSLELLLLEAELNEGVSYEV